MSGWNGDKRKKMTSHLKKDVSHFRNEYGFLRAFKSVPYKAYAELNAFYFFLFLGVVMVSSEIIPRKASFFFKLRFKKYPF